MMEALREEETINYAKISGLVSKLLETMANQFHAQLSSENREASYKITMLDSHEIPDIQIQDYLYRIISMSKSMYRDIIIALVYADRLINDEVISGISYHNMHRLIAISLMTSSKFYDDVHYSNKTWAAILGLRLQELNEMEVHFLEALGYDINVSLESMQAWAQAVACFADEKPAQERDQQLTKADYDAINQAGAEMSDPIMESM